MAGISGTGHQEDGVARRGLDPVSVLTGYLVLLEFVPSAWVVPALGGVGTPSNLYAILALLWYLASWLTGRIAPAPGTRVPRVAMCVFAVALLCAYISLSGATRSPAQAEVQAADRGLIGLIAWIGIVVVSSAGIRDYASLQRLLRRAVVFASYVAGLAIFEFYTDMDVFSSIHLPGLQSNGAIAEVITRGDFTRPTSTASHPLELGGTLAMLLPFAIHQALDPARKGRLRRWAPVALIGATLPLTVSRTSVLGLLVVLIVLLPTWNAARRWGAILFTLLGTAFMKLLVPGLISTLLHLFTSFLSNSDSSTQARTGDYAGVTQYIKERPIFGRGYGTFMPNLYRFTDNEYLLEIVEIGVFGVFSIVLLYVAGMHCGQAGRRLYGRSQLNGPRREVGQSFVAAMAVALVVSATFDSLSFSMFAGTVFLLLGCSGAYLGIARQETAAPPGAAAGAVPTRPLVHSGGLT